MSFGSTPEDVFTKEARGVGDVDLGDVEFSDDYLITEKCYRQR